MRRKDEIVRLENVSKIYTIGKVEYPALRGISTLFYKGELTAVMGPSGSGKSTLLNLIGGLDRPTEGEIIVNNRNLKFMSSDELAEYRNKTIGFVFQFFNLIGYLTVIENVVLPMAIGKVNSKDRKKKAMEILDLLGLGDKIHKKPNELSGGERQRVAIARALVNDPELILADEPTGNVDSENAKIIMNIFRKLVDERGISVIMVTHNIELTKFCDRIIRLKDGMICGEEVIKK